MSVLLPCAKVRVLNKLLNKSAPPETNSGKSPQETVGTGQRVIPGYLLHQTGPTGHGTWPGVLKPVWGLLLVAY